MLIVILISWPWGAIILKSSCEAGGRPRQHSRRQLFSLLRDDAREQHLPVLLGGAARCGARDERVSHMEPSAPEALTAEPRRDRL